MIIGIPKEIKNNENRVGITPRGLGKLVKAGHSIYLEKNAGVGSGFDDAEYKKYGAKILSDTKSIYNKAEMIIKIKEPIEAEFGLIKEGQIVFTYFHLAAEKNLTKFLLKKKITAIAYETVQTKNKKLPLLEPMSQVAGRMSIQIGAHFLEKTQGGRGVLLGGTDEVDSGKVVVIGYGIVGTNAVQMARGLGAEVLVLDIDKKKIEAINNRKDPKFKAKLPTPQNISQALKQAHLVIGAVLIPGAKAPKLVKRQMVKNMKQGAVIVDVAIDQGGCIETSHPTTHDAPVYAVNGVIHYCVPNIPGAVARTSTLALTEKTLPYIMKLADKGFLGAVKSDIALAKGVNTYQGKLTNRAVAETFGIRFNELDKLV